jgi:hypothetical protein
VAINFFRLPEKSLKVIEQGRNWFQDLLKVREKYGLENWAFEIERHGTSENTKTTYTILPEEKITAELQVWTSRAHQTLFFFEAGLRLWIRASL